MKRAMFLLLGLLLLSSVCNKSPTGPDVTKMEPQWAMYGGNVRHTGNVNTPAYDGIIGPTDSNTVAVKWAVNLRDLIGRGTTVQSQPVSDEYGTVYLTTTAGLVALDVNGNLKWHFDELGRAPVTIGDDGTVYYHGNSGNLYALDSDGSVKWRTLTFKSGDPHVFFQTTWMNLVVLEQDIVVVTGLDSLQPTVTALNGDDGSIVWQKRFEEDSGLMSIEAVGDDGTLYIYQEPPGQRLLAIANNAILKWTSPRPGGGGAANFHRVIDADGNLYDFPDILSPAGQNLGPNFLPPFGALWYDRYYARYGRHDTLGCYSISDKNLVWRRRPEDVQFLSFPTVDAEGNMYVLGSGRRSPQDIPGFLFVYDKNGQLLIRKEIHAHEIENYIFGVRFAPLLLPDGSVVVADEERPIVAAIR